MAAEPVPKPPRVEREGLGYVYTPGEAPVTLTFSRIVERREELTAEVHVQTRHGGKPEHVLRRRINLLGPRAPADLSKDLDLATDSAGWPWRRIVESAFASVVESHRVGENVRLLGGRRVAPPAPVHLIPGLLLQNTANTWFGPGGTGKSTAAAAACVAHVGGLLFAGRPCGQGVPLYLDWEDEDDSFERILWEVSRGYGYDESARVYWRRMRSPLAGEVAYLSALIDQLGITFLVIDSATRAMGSAGEHGTYESTAVAFAEAIRALGKLTVLILDHVDGATVKEGGVAKKSYGSIHKLNFVRNAWSLTPDEEADEQTVGWTHAKVNWIRKEQPFGMRYARDLTTGALELVPLEAADVEPVAKSMSPRSRMVIQIKRNGPQSVAALAVAVFGDDGERSCKRIRGELTADMGRRLRTYSDGTVGVTERADPTPIERSRFHVVSGTAEDDDEIPF